MEDLTVKLVELAMNVAQQKQRAASLNLAQMNMPNAQKLEVDFSAMLSEFSELTPSQQSELADFYKANWQSIENQYHRRSGDKIEVDEEVAKSLLSSGQYKGLAEGVSRKLGLMQLAIKGGR